MEAGWLVVLAAGALFVRVGQMLGAMGIARAKNVASAGLRSLADLCVAILCFWAVGAAILFQKKNMIFGIDPSHLIGWGGLSSQWLVMVVLVLLATGIIAPAVAERSRLIVPLALGGLLAAFVIPTVLFWTRFGWLNDMKFIDAAGAAGIHLAPAICAAVAAALVGAREGKYNRDGSSNMIPGHSVLMILMSMMLILAGWTPYVLSIAPGLPLSTTAANVLVSGAAGGLVSLLVGHFRFGKADVLLTCSGIMGGLVSITAAVAEVSTPGAFLIGMVGGILVPWMTLVIDVRFRIDDPGGVIAVHGMGGIWALIAAALFSHLPMAELLRLLGVQLLGIFVVICLTGACAIAMMALLNGITGVRSREADEYDGLDLAEHDINAHPDFQQTMIKSYHLREA